MLRRPPAPLRGGRFPPGTMRNRLPSGIRQAGREGCSPGTQGWSLRSCSSSAEGSVCSPRRSAGNGAGGPARPCTRTDRSGPGLRPPAPRGLGPDPARSPRGNGIAPCACAGWPVHTRDRRDGMLRARGWIQRCALDTAPEPPAVRPHPGTGARPGWQVAFRRPPRVVDTALTGTFRSRASGEGQPRARASARPCCAPDRSLSAETRRTRAIVIRDQVEGPAACGWSPRLAVGSGVSPTPRTRSRAQRAGAAAASRGWAPPAPGGRARPAAGSPWRAAESCPQAGDGRPR